MLSHHIFQNVPCVCGTIGCRAGFLIQHNAVPQPQTELAWTLHPPGLNKLRCTSTIQLIRICALSVSIRECVWLGVCVLGHVPRQNSHRTRGYHTAVQVTLLVGINNYMFLTPCVSFFPLPPPLPLPKAAHTERLLPKQPYLNISSRHLGSSLCEQLKLLC